MNIDELLFECLERMELEGDGALEELCLEHPASAQPLRARVRLLRQIGLSSQAEEAAEAGFPDELGEFRLLEKLGEGGMGAVYRAEQRGMGRQVALKLVRPSDLFFSGVRERFQREVEAVARLAHPAIAMVYTVGEASGVPYFAMELVEGVSLDRVLAELRECEPAQLKAADLARSLARLATGREPASPVDEQAPLFKGSWADACVRIVREVSVALAHAHERGVLHRDLKPSNLMLTPSGRVKLLDFGLASLSDAGRMTRSGTMLGSLPYMAPEQFEERAPDERTDVYGLGILLYELLTLALPFAITTRISVLQREILEGRPTRPSHFHRGLSWEVETVCLTAFARDPRARYASASDLARDLDNLLARRPIEARRVALRRRLLRWMQRSPAAAALLLVTLVGGGTLIVMQGVHSARLGRQRDLARASLEKAIQAIDVMLTEVANKDLSQIPALQPIRRNLLEQARVLFEDIASQIEDPIAQRDQLIHIDQHLGRTLLELDRPTEAIERLEEARAAMQAQGVEDPDEGQWSWRMVGIEHSISEAMLRLGRREEALEVMRAMDANGVRLAESGSTPQLRDYLTIRRNLIGALAEEDFTQEALELARQSEPLLESLMLQPTLDAGVAEAMAMLLHSRALAHWRQGEAEPAQEVLERALTVLGRLFASGPARLEWREDLANLCLTRAGIDSAERGEAFALQRVEALMDDIGSLSSDYPLEARLVRADAHLMQTRARCLATLGDLEQAERLFATSTEVLEALPRPDVPTLEAVGSARNNLANVQLARRELDAAAASIVPALAAHERARALSQPEQGVSGPYRITLLTACEVSLSRGEWREALARAEVLLERGTEQAVEALQYCELHARAAELARAEAGRGGAEAAEQVESLRDRALEWLEVGLRLGYDDMQTLRRSPDLAGLRAHPDFEAVLAPYARD